MCVSLSLSLSLSSRESYGGREHSLVGQSRLLLTRGHGAELLDSGHVFVTEQVGTVDAVADENHVLGRVVALSEGEGGGV